MALAEDAGFHKCVVSPVLVNLLTNQRIRFSVVDGRSLLTQPLKPSVDVVVCCVVVRLDPAVVAVQYGVEYVVVEHLCLPRRYMVLGHALLVSEWSDRFADLSGLRVADIGRRERGLDSAAFALSASDDSHRSVSLSADARATSLTVRCASSCLSVLAGTSALRQGRDYAQAA